MFVHAYFVLCLHRDWFCELTWENVNIWEQFWNVHLLMTLIVLRWPSAVDRTLNSSYQLVCVLWPPDLIQQRTGHHWEPRGEANKGGVHSYRRQEADHVHGRFQHAGQGHVWVTATSGADATVAGLWLLVWPPETNCQEDPGEMRFWFKRKKMKSPASCSPHAETWNLWLSLWGYASGRYCVLCRECQSQRIFREWQTHSVFRKCQTLVLQGMSDT